MLTEFFKAYSFRSDRLSVLVRPFANKWLNLAIVWELLLLGFILYFPPMERVFGTTALTNRELAALVAGVAFTILPVLELGKWLIRRFDTKTKALTTLAPSLDGAEDVAWTRNGQMLMSNGERIYCRTPGARGRWQPVRMKGAVLPFKNASRLALNPANKQLAVVVQE